MSAAVCTHPIDLIKVRMQLAGVNGAGGKLQGPIATLMDVVRSNGIAGIYAVCSLQWFWFDVSDNNSVSPWHVCRDSPPPFFAKSLTPQRALVPTAPSRKPSPAQIPIHQCFRRYSRVCFRCAMHVFAEPAFCTCLDNCWNGCWCRWRCCWIARRSCIS
jgi:hypothetical protein